MHMYRVVPQTKRWNISDEHPHAQY